MFNLVGKLIIHLHLEPIVMLSVQSHLNLKFNLSNAYYVEPNVLFLNATGMPRHRRSINQSIELVDEDDSSQKSEPEKPGQRNAANARERARMRILSKAFSRLKTTLPWVPPDTKLSKLDTLRLATSYIAHLRTILTDDGSPPPIVHPLNLVRLIFLSLFYSMGIFTTFRSARLWSVFLPIGHC